MCTNSRQSKTLQYTTAKYSGMKTALSALVVVYRVGQLK